MKPYPRTVAALTACAAIAMAAGACSKRGGGAQARPPMAVQTAPALKMDTPVVIKAFGNTVALQSVDIVPQVSGLLVKTFIADGAVVTNGQPLFQIDSSDYVSRVQQVQGMVAADRANLELNRLTMERNKPLLEKKLIAAEDFDTIKTRVEASAAQLQMDEAALQMAQLNVTRCTIVSPVAGVCSKRYLNDGNLLTAGMSRLTSIRTYDPIDLEFSVSEQYLPIIRRAMAEGGVSLAVTPQNDTNHYEGKLTFMDNAVNDATGTILLRGQVPNPGLKLWAGQFVEVAVTAGTVRDAVMVPEGAVQFGKMGTYLFIVNAESKAEMRPVKIGVRYNNLLQLVEGAAPGDKVVVLGQLMLYPGAQVAEAAPRPATGAAGGAPGPAKN